MLSKNQISLITSLKQKKYRIQHQLFVAEGKKTIQEMLDSKFKLHHLYTTTYNFDVPDVSKTSISINELKKISFLKTPNETLAVFKFPLTATIDFSKLIVALDNVSDPGNLGTIIRLCDWFGIKDLICSTETVDCYNPKVIQATMGSISRVNITYLNLEAILSARNDILKFGGFMDGHTIYNMKLPESGILVLGDEANGISKNVEKYITHRVSIPRFGDLQAAESLNVANAAAILLSEFRRGSIEM